jgi:hypothetical protein
MQRHIAKLIWASEEDWQKELPHKAIEDEREGYPDSEMWEDIDSRLERAIRNQTLPGDERYQGDILLHAINPHRGVSPSFYGTVNGNRVIVKVPSWDQSRAYHSTDMGAERAAFIVGRHLGVNVPHFALSKTPYGYVGFSEYLPAKTDSYKYQQMLFEDLEKYNHSKLAPFDYLINNPDRHHGNILFDEKGEPWAIDHGLAFHTKFNTPEHLVTDATLGHIDPQRLSELGDLDLTQHGISDQQQEIFNKRLRNLIKRVNQVHHR